MPAISTSLTRSPFPYLLPTGTRRSEIGSDLPLFVGLRGFEPPTFGPPDRRANQAAPQPATQ